MLARACGKADVHDLDPDDLRALTIEAAAITGIPLVGTDWVPGRETRCCSRTFRRSGFWSA